jgi:glyoxylase-like metal-dependent hydrolase (beta-lactamase superfamily II)
MKRSGLCAGIFLLSIGLSVSKTVGAQGMGADADTIVQLSESVFRRGATSNIFIVTDEGIIVVDGTCDGGGQEWLKAELDRRYDVPVKYVILSHDHEMHICGLQAFDDTAVTVAHVNAVEHIVGENRDTSMPDVVFDEYMEILLGGKKVVLYYFGPTHSDNLIQVHFPEEGILVATDMVRSGKAIGLPDYRDSNVDNLINALGELSRLDNVEIVVPGHAGLANQQSFVYFRDWLVALRSRVLTEMRAGASIEDIVERVRMEDFSDYGNYENWLRANVISMWDYLYRWREPSENLGEYQNAYPVGFPIGGTQMGPE